MILSFLSWRWIFWLRAPIGLLALAAAWRFIPAERRRPAGEKLDIPGAIALFFALSGALIAVNRGDSWGWTSPSVLGLFAVSATALVTFLRVESRSPSPIVALPLFKIPTFSAPVLALLLTFVGQAASIFLMPFYLEDIQGYPPQRQASSSPWCRWRCSCSAPQWLRSRPLELPLPNDDRHIHRDGRALFAGNAADRHPRLGGRAPPEHHRHRHLDIHVPEHQHTMGSVDRSMLGTASAATATSRISATRSAWQCRGNPRGCRFRGGRHQRA